MSYNKRKIELQKSEKYKEYLSLTHDVKNLLNTNLDKAVEKQKEVYAIINTLNVKNMYQPGFECCFLFDKEEAEEESLLYKLYIMKRSFGEYKDLHGCYIIEKSCVNCGQTYKYAIPNGQTINEFLKEKKCEYCQCNII